MKKGKRILIVEDEPALLQVLADKFRREGFLVFTARDGNEGLDLAYGNKPDIIVLDIVMPSMDGVTMLKKLREQKWGNAVPVLILSNLSDPEQIKETSGHGSVEYLVKSNWGLDDVLKKVIDTLGRL